MKIGILSMQRVANYGSFWQAFCLKNMIKSLAPCETEFIDIIPGDAETRTEYSMSFSFGKIARIPYYIFNRKKKQMFGACQKKVLSCPDERNYSTDYDSVIIGSDEVFNFVQESPWGFSSQLYGDMDNNNVSTYAACFGRTTLEDVISRGKADKITESMANIKNLSVRDENSREIVSSLTGREAELHADPALIGQLPKNLPEIPDKDYILVYSYDFRLSDPEVIRDVKAFAKKHKLRIISAGFYQTWVDKNVLPEPAQLLAYFRNAAYVVTDTFHGTVFSARMHRKFVTIIRDSNRQKLGSLLLTIGMDDRQLVPGDDLESMIDKDIDYDKFEKFRQREKERSAEYLKKCLKIGS